MIDGWQRGFAGRLTTRHEYLRQVPTVTDIPYALRTLLPQNPRLPTGFVDHPRLRPSARRAADVRLAGPHRPRRRCMGRSAVPAGRVQRGGRDRGRGARAHRRSDRSVGRAVRRGRADGDLGRGVGRRLLRGRGGVGHRAAGAGRRTHGATCPLLAAAGAGLLLGWAIFLNYGLALIALLALAVLITAVDWRAALRALVPRDRRRAGGRRASSRVARLLVVRRLSPGAATLLAGHRQRPAVPVLGRGRTSRRWCARSASAAWPASAGRSTSRLSGGGPACTCSPRRAAGDRLAPT